MFFVTTKGIKYFLHKKDVFFPRNSITVPTYFFRKKKMEGYCELPPGYKVSETKTGLPVVKKI